MFITITIKTDTGQADIRIDSEQKIGEGLKVLRQTGKLLPGLAPDYFRSCIKQDLVSAHKTFAEENIFDGDILLAIESL